jgi:hypothetical protein
MIMLLSQTQACLHSTSRFICPHGCGTIGTLPFLLFLLLL